ncbi:MAG: gliding motility protein GldN [Bacteroidota bacterium]
MLKTWLSCLCLIGSTLVLFAQTETLEPEPPTPAQRSWVNGGAETEFASSPPLSYAPVREADILWEKRVWRVIDTREKINLPFRHPQQGLFDVLAEGLGAGEITAYSPEDDHFLARLEIDDVWDKLNQRDTVMIVDPVTFETIPQVVYDTFDPDRIKRWRVQEVWYQDTRYSQMQVRIIGIAPLLETQVSDAEGANVNFESPLFWINYNDARNWLAQHPVANAGNDHTRMSWEDLFSMRRFHSYIYKESDMRGRRLEDYLSGTDLLLESKKKDRAIQNREMDMWSY